MYPEYFVQLAAYLALHALSPSSEPARGELVFVEASSGLVQTLAATANTTSLLHARLDTLVDFLESRNSAAARRRNLPHRPAFTSLRPGQEEVQRDLRAALGSGPSASNILFLEAPTGFGKTGCLLEYALDGLRDSRYDRLVYLTGKSTGQLQVVHQLNTMTAPAGDNSAGDRLPVWQVRAKAEHCINQVFHCLPDVCPYLADISERWSASGLSRIYLHTDLPRDIDSLRAAGRTSLICPYEITRSALPFQDVWVGDYNYVFAPANRSLFFGQPGFDPAATLLIIDEAHNLPARVADAHSYSLRAEDAWAVCRSLRTVRAPATFLLAWESWARELDQLRPCETLDGTTEFALRSAAGRLAELIPTTALDYVVLGPRVSELIWQLPDLDGFLSQAELAKLLWCPAPCELRATCLDAGPVIAATLRKFRHAILASATLNPVDAFASACGLNQPPQSASNKAPQPIDLTATLGKLPRTARKTLKGLTTASALLRDVEAATPVLPPILRASAPWRSGAYRVAIDTRVDTRWESRSQHFETTASAVAQLAASRQSTPVTPRPAPVAVFFPSYAYAEAVATTCADTYPELIVAIQPRGLDLAAQTTFLEKAIGGADALFLVLGTGYTEGIDLLGGHVTRAIVVGPALPEVNAVQRAKLAQPNGMSREAAFRLVYQVPGMQKVNQAIGRLVRAPGHRATIILHCRRFAEEAYLGLLDPDLRDAVVVDTDQSLATWLSACNPPSHCQ
jgi:Rad3-related DNA helicase